MSFAQGCDLASARAQLARLLGRATSADLVVDDPSEPLAPAQRPLTRTQSLRRLADSGRTVDTTIREYRAARAAWVRRSLQ
jgi:hypothetical protein